MHVRKKRARHSLFNPHFKFVIVGDMLTVNNEYISQEEIMIRYHAMETEQAIEKNQMVSINKECIKGDYHGTPFNIWICMTDGQQKYDYLRKISYIGTYHILLVFSYEDDQALINIVNKWYPELQKNASYASIYLVGLHSENEKLSVDDAKKIAARLHMDYFDMQSLDDTVIKSTFDNIFQKGVRQYFLKRKFPFFARNFAFVDQGLEFAVDAAFITRGHAQPDNILNTLPTEVIFLILYEVGTSLIRDFNNPEQRMGIYMLFSLVYANTISAQATTRNKMTWERTFIRENDTPVQIYPEPKFQKKRNSKSENCITRKRCIMM